MQWPINNSLHKLKLPLHAHKSTSHDQPKLKANQSDAEFEASFEILVLVNEGVPEDVVGVPDVVVDVEGNGADFVSDGCERHGEDGGSGPGVEHGTYKWNVRWTHCERDAPVRSTEFHSILIHSCA